MIVDVVFYVKATGEVRRIASITAEEINANLGEGEAAFIADDHYSPGDIYVNPETQEVLERPEMALAVSTGEVDVDEEWVVGNVPAGTVVIHPDGEAIIDDGQLEWSCSMPGDYVFTFQCFPYKPEILRVKVTP